MKITIFGTGYVGLVTGICFAELGNDVLCVDIDEEKITLLKKGISPIYEPGMDELLTKNIEAKKITFSTDIIAGVKFGEFIFVAVGTPSAPYGSADLQYVYKVAETIGKNLDKTAVIINKSTVPVGTGDKVKSIIQEELDKRNVKIAFDVVSNPEFLKQGNAIDDFMHSERVIIGVDNENAYKKVQSIYAPLKTKIISMDIRSAELSKYAANAFLATKISFINEIAYLSEMLGADISLVKEGIGTDSRIGMSFLNAGCGYGGSCFPKDVKALIWMAREYGCEVPLFDTVENINIRQKCIIYNRIKKYFGNKLKDKVIALWGLAFKPNTDDMREAPSKVLLELLWHEGAKVQAFDPVAMKEAHRIYGDRGDLVFCKSKEEALLNADALAIVTEWDEFKGPNFELLKNSLHYPVIFDGRNLYNVEKMAQLGIDYYCIGKTRKKI